jgi:hypothetical protein
VREGSARVVQQLPQRGKRFLHKQDVAVGVHAPSLCEQVMQGTKAGGGGAGWVSRWLNGANASFTNRMSL